MRYFILPLTLLSCVLFVSVAQAQRTQEERIDHRVEEVREMIDEEQRTINNLERQLKDAVDRDENADTDRLRQEIGSAIDRLERLRDLHDKLLELKDSIVASGDRDTRSQPDRSRSGKGRKKKPVPVLGGFEAGDRDRGNRREPRDPPRPGFGGMDPEGARDGFGRDRDPEERERNQGRDRDRDRDRDPVPPRTGRDRDEADNRDPARSSRLRHLRDALESLTEAGEFGMARNVEQLIRREERRLQADDRDREAGRDRGRDRGRDDDRPRTGNRSRPKRDDDSGNEALGSGPVEVDGGGARRAGGESRRGAGNRDRDRDRETRDKLDELNEEIERLRDGQGDRRGDGGPV